MVDAIRPEAEMMADRRAQAVANRKDRFRKNSAVRQVMNGAMRLNGQEMDRIKRLNTA